jgi:hypothetical protein
VCHDPVGYRDCDHGWHHTIPIPIATAAINIMAAVTAIHIGSRSSCDISNAFDRSSRDSDFCRGIDIPPFPQSLVSAMS